MKTDEENVLAARGGDTSAMEELLEKYKNAVRGIARGYFLEGGDGEDLVQEGMIGLYSAITDYTEGGMSFKNFAYLCIHRRIMSAVKSALRKKHLALNSYVPLCDAQNGGSELVYYNTPENIVIGGEERDEFLQILKSNLSKLEYAAILRYMEGLSIAEIAESEHKNEKSVENAVQRAKNKILKLLQERK